MLDEALEVSPKPYQKPEMSEVVLIMEDVVLGNGSLDDSQDPLSVFDF